MNIKKFFKTKATAKKAKPLDARVFWQWCVMSFLILFLVAVGGAIFLFRTNKDFSEAQVDIPKGNIDQVLVKLEKRVEQLDKTVTDRTHTASTNTASSQN